VSRLGIAALLLVSSLARAQAPTPAPDADVERREDLTRLQARIASLKAALAVSEKSAATLQEELRRLDLRLEIAAREGELLAAMRMDLERRLVAIASERAEAAEAARRSRQELISRARVLHRFGRFGYFRVLLEARDVPALLASLERLDSLARRDGRLLSVHRAAQARLESDLEREAAIKTETDRLYASSLREERRIASLKESRARLLERVRSDSAAHRQEVVALTDKAERLERLLETLARQSDDLPAGPSGGIRPWKGVLDWPARGAIVETFGRHRHPKFDAWTMSNGIALSVAAGAPVRAVFEGKAVYARWLAEYGNLVILDHGDGVFTLYAWLQSVAVRPGDYVPVGQTIGRTGLGPGRAEPGVYFELRDRQKAADPVAWLR
jgi:septal ring factor EnvC (AmiA/AmiB activator)